MTHCHGQRRAIGRVLALVALALMTGMVLLTVPVALAFLVAPSQEAFLLLLLPVAGCVAFALALRRRVFPIARRLMYDRVVNEA